jgi:sulfotransferase
MMVELFCLLKSKRNIMLEKLFFQSSLPRAGSTLLQNIIGQNPDFYVTPTSGLLELVFAARGNYTESPEFKAQDSELMKRGFINFCNKGMKGYFEAITDKKYVMDKSRGWGIHYDFLNEIYPNPKIIVMVRDLRDIFCSMEKNFRKSSLQANPILSHAEMRGTTTPKRIDIWAQSQPVGLAIERLQEVFRQGLDKNMLFVKFEDLCLYPETELNRIYQFLEVPYFTHDFDNIEQITVEDDEVYGVFGDHTIKQKLELPHSQAKKILGPDVTNWIFENYKWFFDRFNYKK